MDFIPYLSFFSGVLSILSPCILPILPILFGFTLKERKNSQILSFTLGLFLIFTILIFVTALFTVLFYSYIFYFRFIAAIVLLIVGILFILNKSFNIAIKNSSNSSSFVLGVLTSIAWAPCYSGYLISLLSLLITSANPLYTTLNIILYAIGFGVTILILNLFLSKINIERFIKSSVYLRQLSGVLFIFGAIYMLLTLFGVILW